MNNPEFNHTILSWYAENKRDLPWRSTNDPYKIWLSEILLQQTRVQQGLPYYLRFISEYPTVQELAAANEQDILKLWQGLGYYSRARNLHKAAIKITQDLNGVFPTTYAGLKALPGIGDYTASAIASICYNLPEAVVDGNVYRVLARYFGIELPVNSSAGIRYFKTLAEEVMNRKRPGEYNQAIMEFGAKVCSPQRPSCEICELANSCSALQTGRVKVLPVKIKKSKIRRRYFNYLILKDPVNHTLMEQRIGKGIWQNLYQFPLIETTTEIDKERLQTAVNQQLPDYQGTVLREPEHTYKIHKLSHQHLVTKFWIVQINAEIEGGISLEEAEKLPMPILLADTIKTLKNSYF